MNNRIEKLFFFQVFVLILIATCWLSFRVLVFTVVLADDAIDKVNVSVPIVCTMDGIGMDSHEANISNGNYVSEIGITTLHAFCNDNNGFAIYATGYTGNKIGETNSNKLVGEITGETIDTGLAIAAGNPDISNWAMKLAIVQDSGDTIGSNAFTIDSAPNASGGADAPFSQYHVVPNEFTKVAHKDSATDMTTTVGGVKLTTTYAAYVSKNQTADVYSGQVLYTLVHPINEVPARPLTCDAGYICYHANSNMITGQMSDQAVTNDASVVLYASNYKRDGYGFAGWNDKYDYTGTFYGPNQTVTAPSDVETNGYSLYAVWVKSAGSMQSNIATVCNGLDRDLNNGSADLGSVSALTDDRDGNTYAIAKLADGKCWTIENLRLAGKDSNNNDIILSSNNTHNPSLPLTNVYNTSLTSNHLSPSSSIAYNATTAPDGWCSSNSSACDNQSRLRTDNSVLYVNNISSDYSASGNVFGYGNYYNWYSATAGHGKYGSNYVSGYTAPGDICPANWRLPIGDTSGDFYALNAAVNNGTVDATASNKLRSYPNNYVLSGSVGGSSIGSRNSSGSYWSASAYNSDRGLLFYIKSNTVEPGTNNYFKYHGRVIRCVYSAV